MSLGKHENWLEETARACGLILDEADTPFVGVEDLRIAGARVDAVDLAEEVTLRVAGIGEAVIWPRDLVRPQHLGNIGRDDNRIT